MTNFRPLSPHFAAGARKAEVHFLPKWGEVLIFRSFLPLQWEKSFLLN